MKILTTDKVVRRKDQQMITSELDNELVMMDMQNGAYLSLNKTGRIIWELIEKPVKIKDIIQKLTDMFHIDEETCKSETINFLSQIKEQKALEVM